MRHRIERDGQGIPWEIGVRLSGVQASLCVLRRLFSRAGGVTA
jgi:hypothetical protein